MHTKVHLIVTCIERGEGSNEGWLKGSLYEVVCTTHDGLRHTTSISLSMVSVYRGTSRASTQ